jgi:hypothetical protein
MKPSSNPEVPGKLARLKNFFNSAWRPATGRTEPSDGKPDGEPTSETAPERRVIEVPVRTGKTGLSELKDLPKELFEKASQVQAHEKAGFYFEEGEFRFDFLFARGSEPRLFVIFSGDIDRKKITPPAFQRWTWADKFPGHCLFVSDPSLHLDPSLGLAWYAGTSRSDSLPTIRRLVREIAGELKIPDGNLYAYGSSGGGFAALRLASIMPELVPIAINPQTDVLKYSNGAVDRCLKLCFSCASRSEAEEKFSSRLSLFPSLDQLRGRRMIYAQNRLDEHHHTTHYQPFVAALGLDFDIEYRTNEASVVLFEHPDGHRKAETSEAFNEIMELVLRGAPKSGGIS